MPKLWKIKAWFHSKFSKALGLVMLAALVAGIFAVWKYSRVIWGYLIEQIDYQPM